MSRGIVLVLAWLACVAGFFSPAMAADAPAEHGSFAFGDKGLEIHAGSAGNFILQGPLLEGLNPAKPTDITHAADGQSLDLKYTGGATAQIRVEAGKSATIRFSNLPPQVQQFRIQMLVPFTFGNGGKYAINGDVPQPFPQDKPAKPFLFQGNAQAFAVIHPGGAGFNLGGFPLGTFQQVQDNREWNWSMYSWFALVSIPADNPEFKLTLDAPPGSTGKTKILIDRFGQHVPKDFPDKVKSEDELKQDVQRDQDYFAALNPPVTDKYGGLPGSGEKYNLKKTGFFHIEKAGNAQVLVDPDGNAFFQLGMCGIQPCDDYTTVNGRRRIYEWLPPATDATFTTAWRPNDPGVISFYLANLIRKYGEPFNTGTFTQRWIDRLRKWGYNSAGAFAFAGDESEQAAVRQSSFPYVTFLPVGGADSLPVKGVWDPFSDNIEENLDKSMAKGLAPKANDPLLIGYFLCNEPLMEDIPKAIPGLKGSKFAAKRRLVQMLQEQYATIDAFNTAWDTKAASFDDLKDMPLAVTTKPASQDMQKYFELFLEARYSLIAKTFHKYDTNHLLIGDRWMPGTTTSETLVRTAAKYEDVISVNYYTYGVDKDFLNRIHTWADNKPLLLSEFYFACRDQGLSGGTQVANQAERGLAYRNYVEQAAATGFVVGIQWFIAHDQASTGRFFEGFSGEGANTGLVNVADRPYKEFLAEVTKTNYDIYNVVLGQRPAFVFDDPRFTLKHGGHKVVQISHMTNPVVMDGQRTTWPGVPPTRIGPECLVMGQDAKDLEANYWLAWDKDNLYVFAEITDPTPMQNKMKDDTIWAADGLELFTGYEDLDQIGSLRFCDRQVLIRGDKSDAKHAPMFFNNAPRNDYKGQSAVVLGADGKSYTIEAAIPFSALGFTPKPGQEILFDLVVDDGGNGRRMLAWNGTARDSRDRGSWGRATFGN